MFKNHEGCISSCSFSKDGKNIVLLHIIAAWLALLGSLLVSGGYDLNVNIYNTANNKLKLGLKVCYYN